MFRILFVAIIPSQVCAFNNSPGDDSLRMKIMDEQSWNIVYSQPDSAIIYARELLKLATEKNNLYYMAYANNTIGVAYDVKSEYEKALSFYNKNIFLYRKMKDKRGEASAILNIGIIYYEQGLNNEALIEYKKSLELFEEINDKRGIADVYNNISIIFKTLLRFEQSMIYLEKAMETYKESNDESGISVIYTNMAVIHELKGERKKALEYYDKAKINYEKENNIYALAHLNNSIGILYANNKEYDKALQYYLQALSQNETIKDNAGIAASHTNIGMVYSRKGNIDEAMINCEKSFGIAEHIGSLIEIQSSCRCLYETYKKKGDYKSALNYYEVLTSSKDSLLSSHTSEMAAHLEFQYKYRQRSFADSVKNAQKQKILDAEIEAQDAKIVAQNAKLKTEQTRNYALFGGIILLVAFAIFIYNRFKVIKKQNSIIEEQKKEVEIQKDIVDEKNKNITDSINYALRIQQSYLPEKEDMDDALGDYFIFYHPKDIVSGDFYWYTLTGRNENDKSKDVVVLALADCTGHGVPGAMMTMIGNTLLNQTIQNNKINTPAEALDFLNSELPKNLKKHKGNISIKDGMDIVMIMIDKLNGKLYFSGANNSIFLVNNSGISILKGDKQPVSAAEDKQKLKFTLKSVSIEKGDCLYLTTDGYFDQFGGPKGKKFLSARFQQLIQNVQGLPMNEQKTAISDAWMDWKGNQEQIDDVCVIGIRI